MGFLGCEGGKMVQENNNYVLIGFMGTGKSTVGKLLAATLQTDFYDVDQEIEKANGKSVQDIFSQKGEGYFRQEETRIIKALSWQQGKVLALGGGAVLNPENVHWLKQNGYFIRLTASLASIVQRVEANTKERPLLQGEDLAARIQHLLQERESSYAAVADLTVETSGLTANEVVQYIISRCGARG